MIGRSRWTRRVIVAAVVVAGISGFVIFEKASPQLLPTALLVCAVLAIAGLITDTGGADPPEWTIIPATTPASSGQDGGLAGNVRLLENHLSAREADPLLRGRLTRLTDDRLARLGLHRSDPEVAERLGPTLLGVITGPPRHLQPSEIEECIRRIEELSP